MLKRFLQRKKATSSHYIDPNNLPTHVAIIMDGNGRWAKRRGMPRTMGHKAGAETLRTIVSAASDLGIKALTVYGFSTENWKRPDQEVSLLMSLIGEYLKKYTQSMHENGVRIRFIGYTPGLSLDLQKIMADAEELTKDNQGLTLHLAINYGGRNELTQAMKTIANDIKEGILNPDDISENLIASRLYTKDFPDVDLLIRPSNDWRISNFLLWQLAYAEFWFTPLHWPDFTKDTLVEAIMAYQQRERRFGGLVEE